MNKTVINTLVDKLVKRWGSQKFVAVTTLTTIGAGLTCLTSATLIPNDPDPEETQCDDKTTKTKKETK